MRFASTVLTLLLLAAVVYLGHQPSTTVDLRLPELPSAESHRLTESMQAKLDHIRDNGKLTSPDQSPTIMTEEEVNEYLNSGKIQLPQGVKKVTLQGRSGVVTGFVNV